MQTALGVADFSENTRLKVRLVKIHEGNWTPRQLAWLNKRKGKEMTGTVEMCLGSLYFRPDRCNLLVLREPEIEILGREDGR